MGDDPNDVCARLRREALARLPVWDEARKARKAEQDLAPNNPPVKGCGHGGNPGDICSDCSFTPTLAPRGTPCVIDGCAGVAEGTSGYCPTCLDAYTLPDDY